MKRHEDFPRLKKALTERPATEADAYSKLLGPLLPKLEHFVKQEFAYLRFHGDLTADYPNAQDILDEVLVRAYQNLDQRPRNAELKDWLYQIAHQVLTEATKHRQAEKGHFVSLDSQPPATPDQTVDEQDEAAYEYWQPDEMLNLEDVVPISDATPEKKASEEETHKQLRAALARLPAAWRTAVWLTQAEEMPLGSVARTLGTSEEETRRWIAQADAFLRARLKGVDLQPATPEQMPAYFAPVPEEATPELKQVFEQAKKNRK